MKPPRSTWFVVTPEWLDRPAGETNPVLRLPCKSESEARALVARFETERHPEARVEAVEEVTP